MSIKFLRKPKAKPCPPKPTNTNILNIPQNKKLQNQQKLAYKLQNSNISQKKQQKQENEKSQVQIQKQQEGQNNKQKQLIQKLQSSIEVQQSQEEQHQQQQQQIQPPQEQERRQQRNHLQNDDQSSRQFRQSQEDLLQDERIRFHRNQILRARINAQTIQNLRNTTQNQSNDNQILPRHLMYALQRSLYQRLRRQQIQAERSSIIPVPHYSTRLSNIANERRQPRYQMQDPPANQGRTGSQQSDINFDEENQST